MMKNVLFMFCLSFTNEFYEDYDAGKKLSNHVFNWFPNAGVHGNAVLTQIHFDWYFGNCKSLQKHFYNKIGIWIFWVITTTGIVINDFLVDALETREWIGDFLSCKKLDELDEEFGADFAKEWTVIS